MRNSPHVLSKPACDGQPVVSHLYKSETPKTHQPGRPEGLLCEAFARAQRHPRPWGRQRASRSFRICTNAKQPPSALQTCLRRAASRFAFVQKRNGCHTRRGQGMGASRITTAQPRSRWTARPGPRREPRDQGTQAHQPRRGRVPAPPRSQPLPTLAGRLGGMSGARRLLPAGNWPCCWCEGSSEGATASCRTGSRSPIARTCRSNCAPCPREP